MRAATAIALLVVVALSAFALLNWTAIGAPTALSIGFTTVHAPLGLILRIGSGLLTAARADMRARRARLEELRMARLAEVGNRFAAHVAEVEDKLDRAVKPNPH